MSRDILLAAIASSVTLLVTASRFQPPSAVSSWVYFSLAFDGRYNGNESAPEEMASFHATVSRKTKDGTVFYGDQKMTREQALKSYTSNGAYAAKEESLKGSIAVGKLADITVLSKDIMTIGRSNPDDDGGLHHRRRQGRVREIGRRNCGSVDDKYRRPLTEVYSP